MKTATKLFIALCTLLLTFSINVNKSYAQCNIAVPNVTGTGTSLSDATITAQSFTACATGPLQNITFTPTQGGIDDFRNTGYFISCKLKDVSNNVLATATFIGSATSTDQWYSGATIVANFGSNVTLISGTTYIFEITTTLNNLVYLFSVSNTSTYSGGNYIRNGVQQTTQDLTGWSVNIGASPCINPTVTANTPANRCGSGSAMLSATPSAGSIQWFTAATGGTTLVSGTNYTISGNNLTITNLTATTTFYAEAVVGSGCTSLARTAVTATVNTLPTIALGSVNSITNTATTFSLPYTATTGSPNQYSITTGMPNAMAGFSAVSNASLTGSPLNITVPASTVNIYNFVATVRNSTTGCVSANNNFAVTVVIPTTPFKTTWKVANNNIIIPTSTFVGAYNYTVNYRKQGTIPFTTISGQTGNCTISGLTNDDVIEVEITGLFPHFYMNNNATEKDKLLTVDAWGNQVWKSMVYSFAGSSNLTSNVVDNPDLSNVTSLFRTFTDCPKFNGNISGWNTEKVTDMNAMFLNASAFNQNIGSWNTANVTNMGRMFYAAEKFDQNISNWNTAKVTDMSQMFTNARVFNQNIGLWNTANVVSMNGMLINAAKFNQPLTNWNTAKVADMTYLLTNASAFNQDLSVLEINALIYAFNMLDGTNISIANYDAMLTGWASQTQAKTGVTFGAGGLKYCSAVDARTTLTKPIADGGKGWTITGDTYDNSCIGTPAPTGAASQTFCAGKTVADLVATGTNIKWYDANTSGNLLPASMVLVNGIVYYATQTVSGVESTNRLAVTVTVNTLPTLNPGSNSPVCAGNTINLFSVKDKLLVNSGGPPPQTYAWTGVNSFTSTLQNPSIPSATLLASGTYQVTVRSFEGCTASATTSVMVNALPVLNPSSNSPVCSGETLFLTAKGNPFPNDNDTYTWAGVNSFTANIQNPVIGNVGMNANGVYTVTATNSANCSASATVLVTVKQTPTLVVSNFTNPTPENNPDGTISFTTNLPNGVFSLSYGSTGSPKDVAVASGAFILNGLLSGVYGNFAVTNDGCTGRNNTEVTLLSTPFTLVKSIATGNWESSTTWNVGREPKAGDVVIIDTGHAVTINDNSNIKDMEVRGRLIYGAIGIIINLGR